MQPYTMTNTDMQAIYYIASRQRGSSADRPPQYVNVRTMQTDL
jgi:hypothetical protein